MHSYLHCCIAVSDTAHYNTALSEVECTSITATDNGPHFASQFCFKKLRFYNAVMKLYISVGSQQESMIMGPQSENLNDWFMENVEMG
jgi:hypothetical protein